MERRLQVNSLAEVFCRLYSPGNGWYNSVTMNEEMHMRRKQLEECAASCGVSAAYLFGSRQDDGLSFLEGGALSPGEDADLDIGVVFERAPEQTYEICGSLYAGLSELFGPFRIDLIFLQETSPLFQYEAICGKRIFCRDERVCDEYEEYVMKTAADLAFKRPEFERDVLEAIRDGYFEIARR